MFRKIFLYPGPLWRLTAVMAWFLAAIGVLVLAPPFILMAILGCPMDWQTKVVQAWFRWVALVCFFKFETTVQGDYDPGKPCLIVSNHQSLLDIPAAILTFHGNVRMVAKRELFWIPLFGQAMRAGGFIPLFRGDKSSSMKALKQINHAFARGTQVWVAPEGTRSEDGSLAKYRWGAFGLAIMTQVPVQPIVVLDSRLAFAKSHILPRVGATIHSVALPQISTLGLKPSDRESIAKRVRELTQSVLELRQ